MASGVLKLFVALRLAACLRMVRLIGNELTFDDSNNLSYRLIQINHVVSDRQNQSF
jgi:hypothetical protein